MPDKEVIPGTSSSYRDDDESDVEIIAVEITAI